MNAIDPWILRGAPLRESSTKALRPQYIAKCVERCSEVGRGEGTGQETRHLCAEDAAEEDGARGQGGREGRVRWIRCGDKGKGRGVPD